MIYNKEYEIMPREDLEQLQIERLQMTLNRVYRNVALYKKKFDENKINIENIRTLKDIQELPFTTKDDLRKSYPYDMFAVPLKDIVRIHSSKGRTGKPIAVGYTKNDINHWSELVARTLYSAGITESDFVQIAYDYSMFTGGFGIHYGAERIGASVIPSSSSKNIKEQLLIMKDYKTSALLSTPSYALDIAKTLMEISAHPEELNLRIGLFGAEPWSEKIRNQIEEKLYIKAYNNYGVNEIVGPGTAGECQEQNGLHINEDHFIVEIIDPETGKKIDDGEEGELVFTTITREGYPLIRYRTGDISSLIEGQCHCGRTTRRIKSVTARTDDLIVIRGLSVFPIQIEEVLKKAEGIEPHYQFIIESEDGIDTLEIQLEVSEDFFNDDLNKLIELKSKITGMLKDETGISAKITFVEQKTLMNNNKRVIYRR
ncbi:MAG: phenylacetate--CoA ligase [Spirochaetota bacterium]|nr:phenylacetate--CoA ligase [Spirochaetota bacterium]